MKVENQLVTTLNNEDFKSEQVSIDMLCDALFLEVFSYFNLDELRSICLVSKKWKQLASYKSKSNVYENAITNKKWAQWFGEDVIAGENFKEEWESLPENIAWILERPCPIFSEKRVMDTHMLVRFPKTLNGGLTLKTLGELVKKYFPGNPEGYSLIRISVEKELGDDTINQSRWVLMTKDVLPGSKNKSYVEKQQIITNLAKKSLIKYKVPGTLEAVACILSYFFDSKTRLFSDKPWTYTSCKDQAHGSQLIVGGFTSDGLHIMINYVNVNVGVAALWKL